MNKIISDFSNRMTEILRKKYIGLYIDQNLYTLIMGESEALLYDILKENNIDPFTEDEKDQFERGIRTSHMLNKLYYNIQKLIDNSE